MTAALFRCAGRVRVDNRLSPRAGGRSRARQAPLNRLSPFTSPRPVPIPPRCQAARRVFQMAVGLCQHVCACLFARHSGFYSRASSVMPSVVHITDQYANNRAEVSHQPTRQRERQMRRFTSAAQLQRFASVHGIVQNLFRVSRHLLRSAHHRLLRTRAFVDWDAVTCAC